MDILEHARASNDLRKGGKYAERMEAKDGSFGFDFEAVYDEVLLKEKLAYTMPDGRKVTTLFEDLGDKTNSHLTLSQNQKNLPAQSLARKFPPRKNFNVIRCFTRVFVQANTKVVLQESLFFESAEAFQMLVLN